MQEARRDESRRANLDPGGGFVAAAAMAEPLQRKSCGRRTQPPRIAVDDGDRRMGELGQRCVVPADQSEVPTHRQAAAIDRPQAPDEQRQAAGEKSGGRHGAIENP